MAETTRPANARATAPAQKAAVIKETAMHRALPYELTQAHIAGLHRQAERDRTAHRARRARKTNHRYAATAHRPPVLPRMRALLTGRTPRSAS
jgi:hypothetical protein